MASGLSGTEIRPRAERLLTDLRLWDRRDESVGSYSRGMQQKVAIAAALITDPPILLLDEPTIGLDVEAARTVKDWIAHLAADEGKTIVLTTHQLAIVQEPDRGHPRRPDHRRSADRRAAVGVRRGPVLIGFMYLMIQFFIGGGHIVLPVMALTPPALAAYALASTAAPWPPTDGSSKDSGHDQHRA
jgi:ABC transporter